MGPLTIAGHRELLLVMGAPVTEQIVLGWLFENPHDDFGLDADCFADAIRQCIWRSWLTLRDLHGARTFGLHELEMAAQTIGHEPVPRCTVWRELQLCYEAGKLPREPVSEGAAWLREVARRRRLQAALVEALEHVAARTAEDTCVRLAAVIDDISDAC